MKIHLKNKLLAEKTVLLNDLKEIAVVKNRKIPDDWEAVPDQTGSRSADPNEAGDRIESYENNTALVRQLEVRLTEVDQALEKMKTGNYGDCVVCGKKIETDRLEANPAAPTCKEHMGAHFKGK